MNQTCENSSDNSARFIPSVQVIATEFDDGDGVLVDLDVKRYYQLNETAMLVWQSLESGKSYDEIVRRMTDEYDVSVEHAASSVNRALDELHARRLIRLA